MSLSANRYWLLAFLLFFLPLQADAARLFTSGCEFQGDSPGVLTDLLEWGPDVQLGATSTSVRVQTARVRSGLSACRFNTIGRFADGPRVARYYGAKTSTTTARAYVQIGTMPTTTAPRLITFWDKGIDSQEGAVRLNAAGTLSYIDDDGSVLATSGTALVIDTWYRIELAYNDVNSAELLIDGVSQFKIGAHDGDTNDAVLFGCEELTSSNCAADIYMDDMAVNDDSGSAQTGFPGAGSIVHMQPDSAGDSNGCSAGDVTSVDEITPDDASSICVLDADSGGDIIDVNVETSTAAGIDSYDTITLVQVGIREAAASAASETWNTRLKSASGGTTSSGTSKSHATTVYFTNGANAATVDGTYTLTSYTDPDTAVAWTPTGTNSLDNMQIGANASDGNPDIRVSTLWAVVEYVDGDPPASGAPGEEYYIVF